MMVKMINPPAGWKYGFPKAIPDDVTDVMAWLVENGYPQEEIDSYGEHFYIKSFLGLSILCSYWIDNG